MKQRRQMAASRLDGLVSELSLQQNHHYSYVTSVIVVMKPPPFYHDITVGKEERVNSKLLEELLYNYKILLAGSACI